MTLSYKITQTFLATILVVSLLGCNSEQSTPEPANQPPLEIIPVSAPPQTSTAKSKAVEIINKPLMTTVLRFKIKPPIVDVHNQFGKKLGTSNDQGVFEIQVKSGNEQTFYFKKEGYTKKTLQINASGEMHISYLRLDPLIPAVALAESGDPKAQLLVGDMYFEGSNGVNQSLSTANYFYSQSAKSGNIESKARLCAILHQNQNIGFVKDSLNFCKEAAKQNNPTALFFLGLLHKQGAVIDKDLNVAKQYFEQAVKIGLEEAQEELDLLK